MAISHIQKGSAAAASGLLIPGMLIVGVNGQEVVDRGVRSTKSWVADMITGTEGDKITLTVRREPLQHLVDAAGGVPEWPQPTPPHAAVAPPPRAPSFASTQESENSSNDESELYFDLIGTCLLSCILL